MAPRAHPSASRDLERAPEATATPALREAVIVVVPPDGDARAVLRADGSELLVSLPQHVSRTWLAAAAARAPVGAVLAPTDAGRWVVWAVFPGPEHAGVQVEVELRGSAVRIVGERSVEVGCGPARVTLSEDGDVRVRGREVLSRASGVNRIKGGAVRIN